MWVAYIFSAKKFQHICVSLVNFNESLTNDVVSFEQLGPGLKEWLKNSLKIIYEWNVKLSVQKFFQWHKL